MSDLIIRYRQAPVISTVLPNAGVNLEHQAVGPLRSLSLWLRQKSKFENPFRLMWSSSVIAKKCACADGQITFKSPRVSRPIRGALRDRHERLVRDAMDVDGVARRAASSRTAKSCGPDIPTLISSWRDDPPVMVAKKPGSPGRARRKPLKPIAQGVPA